MSSWETANIDWDNYDLNDTVSVGKIISDFQGLNSKHLVGNIENKAASSVSTILDFLAKYGIWIFIVIAIIIIAPILIGLIKK